MEEGRGEERAGERGGGGGEERLNPLLLIIGFCFTELCQLSRLALDKGMKSTCFM